MTRRTKWTKTGCATSGKRETMALIALEGGNSKRIFAIDGQIPINKQIFLIKE